MHPVLDPENGRHRRVSLEDEHLRALGDRLVISDRNAEVEKSVLVHRRGLQHRDIDIDETAIVIGRLAKIHRDVPAQAAVVHLALEAGEIPREIVHLARFRIGLDDHPRPHREASANPQVVQLRDTRRERLVEKIRLARAETVFEPRIALDERCGGFRVNRFCVSGPMRMKLACYPRVLRGVTRMLA